ncbi:hypothetical protein, partial [Pseudomonas syringae group genomosp. 7]|uniref:hypothetical protein n=1 Tax=Pseudomonas syringae group genomosp. 7 TaxID=251699 RepID=UPI00376FAAC8
CVLVFLLVGFVLGVVCVGWFCGVVFGVGLGDCVVGLGFFVFWVLVCCLGGGVFVVWGGGGCFGVCGLCGGCVGGFLWVGCGFCVCFCCLGLGGWVVVWCLGWVGCCGGWGGGLLCLWLGWCCWWCWWCCWGVWLGCLLVCWFFLVWLLFGGVGFGGGCVVGVVWGVWVLWLGLFFFGLLWGRGRVVFVFVLSVMLFGFLFVSVWSMGDN